LFQSDFRRIEAPGPMTPGKKENGGGGMEKRKEFVAYVFEATKEGMMYKGIRKIEIVKDITEKRIVRMIEIPAYIDVPSSTEGAVELLKNGQPVVIYGRNETSRTGLHYCKARTRVPVIVKKIVPLCLLSILEAPAFIYTEDTPTGKVEYAIVGKRIDSELREKPTVFLSTLRQLVAEKKAKVEYEDEHEIEFAVIDEEIKKKLEAYKLDSVIVKHKIPKQFLESTIVIPL